MASWRAPGSILEAFGLDFGRVGDVPGQVLEGLRFIFGMFLGRLMGPTFEATC